MVRPHETLRVRLPQGSRRRRGSRHSQRAVGREILKYFSLRIAIIFLFTFCISTHAASAGALDDIMVRQDQCVSTYPDRPSRALSICETALKDGQYLISIAKSELARDRFTLGYLNIYRFKVWALWKSGRLAEAQKDDCAISRVAHELGRTTHDADVRQQSAMLALGLTQPDLQAMPIKPCD